MTDEELIARLREIQGQAGLFASEAADRIEQLVKDKRWIMEERDRTFALMLARAEAAEAKVEGLTGAGSNLVAQLYQMWTEARDHRDRGELDSAEYAKRDMAASAFRDAYLAARAALAPTDASTQKGGDAHAVDPRHAPHEASPGVTAGADAAQARECAECGERDPRWQSACPLSYCPHVNDTPKSEHDAGNVLTPAQAREAARHIENAKRLRRDDWQEWTAQDIEDAEGIICAFLALIGKART